MKYLKEMEIIPPKTKIASKDKIIALVQRYIKKECEERRITPLLTAVSFDFGNNYFGPSLLDSYHSWWAFYKIENSYYYINGNGKFYIKTTNSLNFYLEFKNISCTKRFPLWEDSNTLNHKKWKPENILHNLCATFVSQHLNFLWLSPTHAVQLMFAYQEALFDPYPILEEYKNKPDQLLNEKKLLLLTSNKEAARNQGKAMLKQARETFPKLLEELLKMEPVDMFCKLSKGNLYFIKVKK